MDKKTTQKIRDILKRKDIRDYSYAIMFFLVSSFFVLFVIRPVLSIAVSLSREAEELAAINKIYEDNISTVLKLQADLEEVRVKQQLLTEALPETPGIKKLIDDIENAAREQNIELDRIIIRGIYLKSPPNALEGVTINPDGTQLVDMGLTINGSYSQVSGFIVSLLNQRRIKNIRSFTIKNLEYATKSSVTGLQLDITLESFYL